jgi:hypothetical protein
LQKDIQNMQDKSKADSEKHSLMGAEVSLFLFFFLLSILFFTPLLLPI